MCWHQERVELSEAMINTVIGYNEYIVREKLSSGRWIDVAGAFHNSEAAIAFVEHESQKNWRGKLRIFMCVLVGESD